MASGDACMLFAGSSHEALAKELAQKMGTSLGKLERKSFPDGETGIEILENVRMRDVFILQTIARRPNDYLMELFIMIDALKRASAKSITAVIPYFGYARQDRRDKGRVPITAKLVANLIEEAGATRAITMDLHTEQVEGFFDIPTDNLYARPLFIKAIRGMKNLVVVSPDIGSNKMARRFAEEVHAEIAIVDKRRRGEAVEALTIIGDVSGKNALIVDDICSTGKTLQAAAKLCKKEGATSVTSVVTHNFIDRDLEGIEKMITTNSIPQKERSQLEMISIAPLLMEAIECTLSGESISSLYRSNL